MLNADLFKKKNITKKSNLLLFFELFNELLKNGIPLIEALKFIKKIDKKNSVIVELVEGGLSKGEDIVDVLCSLTQETDIIMRIKLSRKNNIETALTDILWRQKKLCEKKDKLIKSLTYPCFLLVFIIVILLFLKFFLVPNLRMSLGEASNNFGLVFIDNSPFVLGGLAAFIALAILIIRRVLSRLKTLEKNKYFAKLKVYKIFLTYQFASVLGNVLASGAEMQESLKIIRDDNKGNFVGEIARVLETGFNSGIEFYRLVDDLPFFTPEFTNIIRTAQVRRGLGIELQVYANLCFDKFLKKLDSYTKLIQPLIFVGIAAIIVSVYAAMLLPVYESTNNML